MDPDHRPGAGQIGAPLKDDRRVSLARLHAVAYDSRVEAGRGKPCRIVITFRLGKATRTKVPVARGPREGEDLASFVRRIARHAGIAWEEATVRSSDGTRREVRRDTDRA